MFSKGDSLKVIRFVNCYESTFILRIKFRVSSITFIFHHFYCKDILILEDIYCIFAQNYRIFIQLPFSPFVRSRLFWSTFSRMYTKCKLLHIITLEVCMGISSMKIGRTNIKCFMKWSVYILSGF